MKQHVVKHPSKTAKEDFRWHSKLTNEGGGKGYGS